MESFNKHNLCLGGKHRPTRLIQHVQYPGKPGNQSSCEIYSPVGGEGGGAARHIRILNNNKA